jgi:hypothetical protein
MAKKKSAKAVADPAPKTPSESARIAELESEIAALKDQVAYYRRKSIGRKY